MFSRLPDLDGHPYRRYIQSECKPTTKKTAENGGADDGGKTTKQPKNRLTFAKWGYFWGYFII